MKQYLDLVNHVLETGVAKGDRTGTGTLSIFGYQMRFNLQEGFPLLTTKKLHWKSIAHELIWFLMGDTNTEYLNKHGVTIWDEWAHNGELGPVYGKQWRSWPGHMKKISTTIEAQDLDDDNSVFIPFKYKQHDQLANVIESIKINPNSRRHIISAWNVIDLPIETLSPQLNVQEGRMALAPCHMIFQFYVSENKLSCHMYQRSADIGLGVPYNIASYALLTHIIANICNLEVGDFIHSFGDAHIYTNHINALQEQLTRTPKHLPTLNIHSNLTSIEDVNFEILELNDYDPHPHIPMDISI